MTAETTERLYQWLEDDRSRRQLRVRADACEIWWVSLWIDGQKVSSATGNDLDEVLIEALAGILIWTPPKGETELV